MTHHVGFKMAISSPNRFKTEIDFGDNLYHFVDQVPSYLTCIICFGLLEKAVATECCGKMMCQSHWSVEEENKQRSCPNCRESRYTASSSMVIDRIIKDLKVHCLYHEDGCEWTGDLSAEPDHRRIESGCPFEPVRCQNNCGESIKRKDMKNHLLEECSLRPSYCYYCPFSSTRAEVESHSEMCTEHPITCPNHCSDDIFPRRNLDAHLHVCPDKAIPCAFAKSGCKVVLKKKEVDGHMTSATSQHLLLLLEQNCRLQEKTELLKTEEEHLKKEVQTLHEKCQDLEVKNGTLEIANMELVAKCDKMGKTIELKNVEIGDMKTSISRCLTWTEYLQHVTNVNDTILPVIFSYDYAEEDIDDNDSWRSPSFYTTSDGYRLCMTVVPNGHRMARNKFLSILFSVLPGSNDDDLNWPFEGELEISVYNQKKNADHFVKDVDFYPFPENRFCRQYYHDDDKGWGILRFMKHEKLQITTSECQYLLDGTMTLGIKLVSENPNNSDESDS